MKVVIATGIYPPESGGPATYAKLLHDELPARGFEVVVVAFRDVRHLPKVLRHLSYAYRVWRVGRNADILYAQDTLSVGVPTRLANIFLRKKVLIRVPGDHVWEQASQRFGATETLDDFPVWSWRFHPVVLLMRTLQLWVVRGADALVTPSDYVRKIVLRWGVEEARVHTIYSGIALPVKTTHIDIDTVPSQPRIVSVARLVPWKGMHALIELVSKEPAWQLIIGDDGPLRSQLEAQARASGVFNRVLFLGRKPHAEMMGWIATADVFVLNSTYEGLSHLLIEAMALGVPVVASAVGGNPELIQNGTSGILVPSGDTEALHAVLQLVLTDTEKARALSQGARERAQGFSITVSLEKLTHLLHSL